MVVVDGKATPGAALFFADSTPAPLRGKESLVIFDRDPKIAEESAASVNLILALHNSREAAGELQSGILQIAIIAPNYLSSHGLLGPRGGL